MEVQIISKEIIKPISPTPTNLKIYNLSFLDQIAPPSYTPIILFYSSAGENGSKISDNLKKSFSETLTHFYPLAGRIKDQYSVECNDSGAPYIEAHVKGDISVLVSQEPGVHELEKLLPCNPHDKISQMLLAAQVNRFDCGGIAISVCVWHALADGSALAAFITTWAGIASAKNFDVNGVIFDTTSLFPPQDVGNLSLRNFFTKELLSKVVVKRFIFDSCKMGALREEVGNGPYLERPTRVEAVAAIIWAAVVAGTGEEHFAGIAVDLRKRIIPLIPELSIGNIYQVILAKGNLKNDSNVLDYNGLAGKIHESIGKMSNEYVRKIHEGGGYVKFMKKNIEENEKNPKVLGISSWCRFPFYEADFGWGKPIWVGTAIKLHKAVIFIDTKDGEGIEAWVSLPMEVMLKFEQNPAICAYASFKPST